VENTTFNKYLITFVDGIAGGDLYKPSGSIMKPNGYKEALECSL
jgi:hypothetical protein